MTKPNPKRVFLDTNILMYDFFARNIHYLPQEIDTGLINATEEAMRFIRKDKNLTTYLASFSIPRLSSLLSQRRLQIPRIEIVTELERVLEKNNTVGLSATLSKTILAKIKKDELIVDIEDAFQYAVCVESNCFYLLTADGKGFKGFTDIDAIHPTDYRSIEY